MNPGLVAIAIVVVAGGVLAVSSRESRAAVVGVALLLVAAPLLDGRPIEPLVLAARLVAGVLAAYVLWAAMREPAPTEGSPLGWPSETLLAGAAAAAGFATARGVVPGTAFATAGPAEALSAAFALGCLAVAPLASGRDALRLAIGLLLALHAVMLLRVGLAGSPPPLEQLAFAGLLLAIAATSAWLAMAALRISGSLDLGRGRAGAHRAPEAAPTPAGQWRRVAVGPSAAARRTVGARSAGARRLPGPRE